MVIDVDPSRARADVLIGAMSATIRPGMLKSASSSPWHMRSTAIPESGPVTRSSNWCRSPVKVSERQSTDTTSVSKILSRGTRARPMRHLSNADAAGDMATRVIGHPFEDRRGLARPFPAEGRGRCVNRRRIADLQQHRGQIGWEPFHYGAGISPLL